MINSKEIVLFSIFSGIFNKFLGFRCSPLSHFVKTSISEFPSYASFGSGWSHVCLGCSGLALKKMDSMSKKQGKMTPAQWYQHTHEHT